MFIDRRYIDDIKFGEESERNEHSKLEKIFGMKFRTTTKYATFDFINDKEKTIIELKTIRYNRCFPAWMMIQNKINKARNLTRDGWDVYFVLLLQDGKRIFYLWDEEDFDDKCFKPFQRGDRMDCVKNYYYIKDNLFDEIGDDDLIYRSI